MHIGKKSYTVVEIMSDFFFSLPVCQLLQCIAWGYIFKRVQVPFRYAAGIGVEALASVAKFKGAPKNSVTKTSHILMQHFLK